MVPVLRRHVRWLGCKLTSRLALPSLGPTGLQTVGCSWSSSATPVSASTSCWRKKFVLFGKHCQAPLDYQQQYISARLSSAKTVTIAISNSGRTVTVVDAAKAAKLAGGRVISITGEASPLSELSDLDIRAGSGEETGAYAPMVSRVAALAIIDILATGVGMRASRAYLDQVRTMNEGLNKRRVGEFS